MGKGGEGGAGPPLSRELDTRLDPRTTGSKHELKADDYPTEPPWGPRHESSIEIICLNEGAFGKATIS